MVTLNVCSLLTKTFLVLDLCCAKLLDNTSNFSTHFLSSLSLKISPRWLAKLQQQFLCFFLTRNSSPSTRREVWKTCNWRRLQSGRKSHRFRITRFRCIAVKVTVMWGLIGIGKHRWGLLFVADRQTCERLVVWEMLVKLARIQEWWYWEMICLSCYRDWLCWVGEENLFIQIFIFNYIWTWEGIYGIVVRDH